MVGGAGVAVRATRGVVVVPLGFRREAEGVRSRHLLVGLQADEKKGQAGGVRVQEQQHAHGLT